MISAHLPILQVAIPLIAAPACVVMRAAWLAWAFALLITWAALAMACALLIQVLDAGPISYELGGWAAPWGIEYRLGVTNAFVLVIVGAIGALVMPFARQSVLDEVPADRHYLFYSAYLLCLTGLLGVVITGDAFNLFVFLEISSLSSYVLISLGRSRRALTAAYQYLIMGTIGATFIVIGVGLLYMATGTLNMADMAVRIPESGHSRTVLVAFAFVTVGASLKLALFPLHLWLPNAYAYAPSMVTAFLAATATKVGVYILLRFTFTVFGFEFAYTTLPMENILLVLAILATLVGSTVAIFQTDIKRLLAYSSVAQIGYMVLGIGLATVTGLTGSIVHLFNHAVTKGGLFLAIGCVFFRLGSVQLHDIQGLGRHMPFTMAAFVAGGLSLIGIPLTVGFISKWYLVLAALERGWWPVAALIVFTSLLAVVYIWRVVEAAYFHDRADDAAPVSEAPLSMVVPTWLLIAASVYFGIYTSLTTGTARRAAEALLGGGL